MKKILLILIAGAMFSSCNHAIYSTQALNSNYEQRMSSKKERAIKEQVKIYMADDQVGRDYEVLYVNTYKPFNIPVFLRFKKQMTKKFYQKAVLKANDLKGDAVIIEAVGNYKVVKYK